MYTRAPLNSMSSRVFSAGCFHGHGTAVFLSAGSQLEPGPLSTVPRTLFVVVQLEVFAYCTHPTGIQAERMEKKSDPNRSRTDHVWTIEELLSRIGL